MSPVTSLALLQQKQNDKKIYPKEIQVYGTLPSPPKNS